MKIETKFSIGQRVGYKERGPEKGYMFMVGPVVCIHASVQSDGSKAVIYQLRFDDAKMRSGWRDWFNESELEALTA